jgi:hypothetical protein
MKKSLLTSILFLGIIISGFAQSIKLEEKAHAKVAQLNTQIIDSNKSAALTDDQKEKIYAIELDKLNTIKALKKDISDKTELKEKSKLVYQESSKALMALLTKEQKVAKKAFKEKQ